MDYKDLTPEHQEKIKTAKTREELEAIAADGGFELSDEILEGVAGGWIAHGCLSDSKCLELKDLGPMWV